MNRTLMPIIRVLCILAVATSYGAGLYVLSGALAIGKAAQGISEEMPEVILTVDGEPRKLIITDADGRVLGSATWEAGAFKDLKIILKQHKR